MIPQLNFSKRKALLQIISNAVHLREWAVFYFFITMRESSFTEETTTVCDDGKRISTSEDKKRLADGRALEDYCRARLIGIVTVWPSDAIS